ncbi:pickpocket protein 28-like [Diabrotica undecimpunctata]|uniref:pickpocket protein 28-like n=1 Tax=Diabrotica undecimpunctata TaxID=50387 RepID=UPI003B63AF01
MNVRNKPGLITFKPTKIKKSVIEKMSFFEMLRDDLNMFCNITNLHGYKFIAMPGRKKPERVIWFILCIALLVLTLTLVMQSWFTNEKEPLLLLTESNHYAIYNYDFPAITICNNNKITKRRALWIASNFTNSSIEDFANDLRSMFYLIKFKMPNATTLEKLTKLQKIFDQNNVRAEEILQKLTSSCESILVKCLWKGLAAKCTNLFQQIRTTEGFCCSFNSFLMKEQYTKSFSRRMPLEPQKISSCGYQSGLIALVNNDPDDYFASFVPSIGQRIKVTNPYDFPDWNFQNILNPTRVVNLIAISPVMTISPDDIRSIPIHIRECLFPDERQLIYYRNYNFNNCLIECRMNITRKLCNCTPFHYIPENHHYRSIEALDCNKVKESTGIYKRIFPMTLVDEQQEIILDEVKVKDNSTKCIQDTVKDNRPQSVYNECNMSPTPEIVKSEITRALKISKNSGGVELKDHSVLRIFFNDLVGLKNRRQVNFTWDQLVAFYGGLLGIFLGFSIVCGIEIFYFFMKRILTHTMEYTVNHSPVQKYGNFQRDLKSTPIQVYPANVRNQTNAK